MEIVPLNAMDSRCLSDKWVSRFISPAQNLHDFELIIEADEPISARLKMSQTKQGESVPSLEISYKTQAVRSGDFVGLLSTDPGGLGLNSIVLQLTKDAQALRGHLVWNSISDKCVLNGAIGFKRSFDRK